MRFLPSDELKDLGKCIVAASAFASNILFFRRSGYFDNSSLIEPLLHTWTLSIEEQFYIFWPWILALLQIPWLRRRKLPITLLLVAGSLGLSSFWVSHKPLAAFYLLPSRAFELAIGALLSISCPSYPATVAKTARKHRISRRTDDDLRVNLSIWGSRRISRSCSAFTYPRCGSGHRIRRGRFDNRRENPLSRPSCLDWPNLLLSIPLALANPGLCKAISFW